MFQIPMLNLRREYEYLREDIDSSISRCLEHQRWILGPEVRDLEEKMAAYLEVDHCIGVSSGTEALVLSLRALAIKIKGREYFDEEDEILTTPFTFIATADAILRAGATPVFVDIDPATFNIDPARIAEYLEGRGSKVMGVIPVHLYGLPCPMKEIIDIAEKYGLFIIEDVAQAIGARWEGRMLGSLGGTGAFSFFPSKNLGAFGDGGMISTKDDTTADLVRMLLTHGGRDKYNVTHIGYNARLDTLQAAILLAKVRVLDEFNEKRRKIACLYEKGLSSIKDIVKPAIDDDRVFHQYTIRITRRDELQKYLEEQGIETMIYYPLPLHKQKLFLNRSKKAGSLSESESAATEVLSLPLGPLQSEKESFYVVDMVGSFFSYQQVW